MKINKSIMKKKLTCSINACPLPADWGRLSVFFFLPNMFMSYNTRYKELNSN